ncbi:MAG: FAD-dependent oxidoreductase [Thermanaeromonas sp.]|uniref:NAD(P)/FAD-dependent oxidoreductase n=1 Tax=Thermanaeromonas sp. TaxID=2003697 RepID=UPI00243F9A3C|nr:FAD-dependent oxidoreductase [Thermanaeromonas sp.]MCG0278022.1 FAD-dependent oxidoreductase [Thermanaeromonas sp.]
MRYVVIGNGAAGTAAAEALAEAGAEGEIIVLSEEPYPYYARVLTSYYVAGWVKPEDIWLADTAWYTGRKIDFRPGQRVVGIDPLRRKLMLEGSAELEYDRLLIATGASPQKLEVPGADLPGVFTLRTLDDARKLKEWCRDLRFAVVVGGGLVGVKAAEALKALGLEVSLVVSSPHLLSQALDAEGALLLQEAMEQEGYRLYLQEDVVALEGSKKVEGARLRSGRTLPAQVVVVAKGVRPNISFLEGSGIEVGRGILVNEYLETTRPGIFAAGDVAEAYDRVREAPRVNALWGNAREQGRIAGLNMAGKKVPYRGSLAQNSLICAGLGVITGGVVNPPEEGEYEVRVSRDRKRRFYRKAVLQGRRLTGMVAVGPTQGTGPFMALLGKEVKEEQVKAFLSGSFSLAHVLPLRAVYIGRALQRGQIG